MITLRPQFIKDEKGNNHLVIITTSEFNAILEELEDLEDIQLYDEAKKDDSGERITISDYLKSRGEHDG